MQLLNFTSMTAGYTMGMRPDGRTLLVVVVKGTFRIPESGESVVLADQQSPIIDADVYTGEPGLSATLYESEYAPEKPRCDILLNGSAHAPNGRPTQRVPVALRVGALAKTFSVVGPRVWTRGLTTITPSEPEFFVKLPISYDAAFGGIDDTDPDKPRYFDRNHAGKGFSHHMNLDKLIGQPLPTTEEIDNPVNNPRGNYQPMAFGPIGRSWQPRPSYAGTYDKNWEENVCPFLPADFKPDHYQSAPLDQQTPYLQGGEEVSLLNLTPSGKTSFNLPRVDVPISVLLRGRPTKDLRMIPAVIDTLLIEPDASRISMIWRASWPLRNNLHEIKAVSIGRMSRAVRISIDHSKSYFPSLGAYVEAQHADD